MRAAKSFTNWNKYMDLNNLYCHLRQTNYYTNSLLNMEY